MSASLLEWSNYMEVYTDIASHHEGLQALIQQKSPGAVGTHCMIHRQALAFKDLSPVLEEVLQTSKQTL